MEANDVCQIPNVRCKLGPAARLYGDYMERSARIGQFAEIKHYPDCLCLWARIGGRTNIQIEND